MKRSQRKAIQTGGRHVPDIRYVCLSDTHLGEEDSLLTGLKTDGTNTDPGQQSPVAVQLVECLRELISTNESGEKPTLILNGDILEMALSDTNEAAMGFQRFVELTMEAGRELFSRVIYVPGNHDHHLWESARETQYVNHIMTLKPDEFLPAPWHTTNMFVEKTRNPVPCYFLTRLVRRYPHLKHAIVATAYPNFGLFKEEQQKCVIFHHGHFVEPVYQLMSIVRDHIFPDRDKPTTIWGIEAENFAWIDFFWSTLGRSGGAGRDVEAIYEKMLDLDQFKKLLDAIAENLARTHDMPGWGDIMESKILKWIFRALLEKAWARERNQTTSPLSEKAQEGLQSYVEGPLRNQILVEREGIMPRDVTFVFGHTHKPFEKGMDFENYPERVDVYNTGGWVIGTTEPEPLCGGALLLVDENLDTVSLRIYNESAVPENYKVSVEEATHRYGKESLFYRRIMSLVDASKDPWKTLSYVTAEEIHIRARNLRARIHKND